MSCGLWLHFIHSVYPILFLFEIPHLRSMITKVGMIEVSADFVKSLRQNLNISTVISGFFYSAPLSADWAKSQKMPFPIQTLYSSSNRV